MVQGFTRVVSLVYRLNVKSLTRLQERVEARPRIHDRDARYGKRGGRPVEDEREVPGRSHNGGEGRWSPKRGR